MCIGDMRVGVYWGYEGGCVLGIWGWVCIGDMGVGVYWEYESGCVLGI